MKVYQLEAKVLELIERAQKGEPVEDSTVELKAEWPSEHKKTARQIAGHANAARGAPILWVIGVDEGGKKIVGTDQEELANWWPKIQKCFDGLAPNLLLDLNIPRDGKSVTVLYFETERAPYVVKNPKGGSPEFEVPWRYGRSTRSAKRSELLRILSPLVNLPEFECLEAELSYQDVKQDTDLPQWRFTISLYVYVDKPIILPRHNCRISFRFSNDVHQYLFENVRFESASTPPNYDDTEVKVTPFNVILANSGVFQISASTNVSIPHDVLWKDTVRVMIKFHYELNKQPVSYEILLDDYMLQAPRNRHIEGVSWKAQNDYTMDPGAEPRVPFV